MRLNIYHFKLLQEYIPLWHYMRDFTLKREITTEDTLLVLEHHPVFTLGQAASTEHIFYTPNTEPTPIPIIACDRGGQVTYHGPGQLILYPLLDLGRLHLTVNEFVRHLEAIIITTLNYYQITATTQEGAPGVYVNGAKVASIGLRCRNQRCYHGISINFNMNLTPFKYINPCGYKDMQVANLNEYNATLIKQDFLHTLLDNLSKTFHYTDIQSREIDDLALLNKNTYAY